jgi:hypothetical protein
MGNMMWFMMGQSWGHSNRPVYVNNGQGGYGSAYQSGSSGTYESGVPASMNVGAMNQSVEPVTHWFLRALLWVMILGLLAYVIHTLIQMRKKKSPATPKRNYSL